MQQCISEWILIFFIHLYYVSVLLEVWAKLKGYYATSCTKLKTIPLLKYCQPEKIIFFNVLEFASYLLPLCLPPNMYTDGKIEH